MPRLVRRKPLLERVTTFLDPWDLLLWLSEELNDDVYDEWLKQWSTPIGLALNIVFILAQGASARGAGRGGGGGDDVFGDDSGRSGSGWFAWLAAVLVYTLIACCGVNALFTFLRRRSYRLFEQAVDVPPPTPSAHRVRVDSSPMSSSPLRYLQAVVSSATASSRAYPDAEREVWELNLWDPKPFNLSIFTLFSPGHVVIYSLLLPPAAMDPRPSVTVLTALAFSALLSAQLWLLKASFSQQAKDSALIHGEVMNEYDTKFVHPNLIRPMRDVGIQSRVSGSARSTQTREVDVYTPTIIIKRGFKTNPNPNYARHYDPDDLASRPDDSRRNSGAFTTPTVSYINGSTQPYSRPSATANDFSSPIKPHHERLRERSPAKGDGGSMGVYNHATSPLRKAASSFQLRPARDDLRRTIASPLKRMSTSGSGAVDPLDRARRRETGRY